MVFDATGCSELALDQASFSQLNIERALDVQLAEGRLIQRKL